ncbi:uncharacterized protein LOC134684138 isoform X2 [Mytilus trossulus]|uniref:uncharacterized protein LOC134684138 isoform X2 n=1 Tax=Mytilus trossulus TaxID=6551 RepID=UPI003005050A
MAKYIQIYMILLAVVFISKSTCVIQFLPGQVPGLIPGQIPRQIIPRQVIMGQDVEEEQQELFLIDEVDGPGRGTGSFLQLFPIPLLTLVLPIVAMAMMTMMSTANSRTTSITPTNIQVTVPNIVPTTQTAVLPTPCVPTNCPEGYMLLDDQTISPNCYFHSTQDAEWANALSTCTMTQGAYLWRPNTEAEAKAVFEKFLCSTTLWTGAYSPGSDGNYVFAVENGVFDYTNVPFGNTVTFENNDCIGIQPGEPIFWNDEPCKNEYQYICEFPRKTCP